MNCQECKELLVAYIEGLLDESQKQTVTEHLDDCSNCQAEVKQLSNLHDRLVKNGNNLASSNLEDDVMNEIMQQQNAILKAGTGLKLRRIIMKSPITKLAAAAVIVIAVLVGIYHFGSPIESVALAEVIRNIEQAPILSYRLKTSITGLDQEGTTEIESMVYNSAEHGIRVDNYIDGKVASTSYMDPEERVLVTVVQEAKMYLRMPLTEQQLGDYHQKNDLRAIVRQFMSFGYTELGRDNINGVEVEGIEINNPAFAKGAFENLVARFWVDVETKTPVLLEMKAVTAGGDVQMQIVMEQFELVLELEPDYFEPNIPSDYTLMTWIEGIDSKSNEEKALLGLKAFAEIAYGRHPSSLALATAMTEAGKALKESGRDPNNEEEVNRMMSNMIRVPAACAFYAELVKEDRNVAYYGDIVTAEDTDAVLMRWKISDDQYRVIFGDLTAENVSAEELAELESQP